MYIYMSTVNYSWPNGWTEWADIRISFPKYFKKMSSKSDFLKIPGTRPSNLASI